MTTPTITCDVAMIGGGPAGVGASITVAQQQLRVLLIEQYGFLGGRSAAALHLPWRMRRDFAPSANFAALIEHAKKAGNCRGPFVHNSNPDYHDLLIEPETLKYVFQETVLAAGVDLLCHAKAISVEKDDSRITSLILRGQEGKISVQAPLYIDCTGLGTFAASPKKLPAVYSFVLTNTSTATVQALSRQDLCENFPGLKDLVVDFGFRENEMLVHLVLDELNPEDTAARTAAELFGPNLSNQLTTYLEETVTGFENTRILMTPAEVGFAGAFKFIPAANNRHVSDKAKNLLCAGRPLLDFNANEILTSMAPHTFRSGEEVAALAVSLLH